MNWTGVSNAAHEYGPNTANKEVDLTSTLFKAEAYLLCLFLKPSVLQHEKFDISVVEPDMFNPGGVSKEEQDGIRCVSLYIKTPYGDLNQIKTSQPVGCAVLLSFQNISRANDIMTQKLYPGVYYE